MKRLLSLLLALLITVSFVSCGNEVIDTSATTQTTTTSTTTTSSTTTTTEVVPIVEPEFNSDFAALSKEIFQEIMEDDLTEINSLFEDPAYIDYERPDGYLLDCFEYETPTQEEIQESYDEINDYILRLKEFDPDNLNTYQQIEYEAYYVYLNLLLEPYKPGCSWVMLAINAPIDQYGGYVSYAISIISDYKLRNETDLKDIINFTKTTIDKFPTYIDYVKDRIDAGFELSDYTIDQMIDFLQGIVDAGDSYYLLDVVEKKVAAIDFLSDTEKTSYITEFKDAILNNFIVACENLIKELPQFKGLWTDPDCGYVVHYGEAGREYANWKLKNTLFTLDVDLDTYGKYVKTKNDEAIAEVDKAVSKINNLSTNDRNAVIDELNNTTSIFGLDSYDAIMTFILDNSKSLVKPLANKPEIVVSTIDETLGSFVNYQAYYNLSEIDVEFCSHEYITVNPVSLTLYTDVISTLAHEGYPGHLYSHVFCKQSDYPEQITLLHSLASNEGWAQYASYKLLKDYSKQTTNTVYSAVASYIASVLYNDYMYSCYIDYVVNYAGYNVKQVAKEFKISEADALDYIHYCDEIVSSMAAYGYGFAKMLDIHKTALVGVKNYNEAEFNSYLMINGGLVSIDRCETITQLLISKN